MHTRNHSKAKTQEKTLLNLRLEIPSHFNDPHLVHLLFLDKVPIVEKFSNDPPVLQISQGINLSSHRTTTPITESGPWKF